MRHLAIVAASLVACGNASVETRPAPDDTGAPTAMEAGEDAVVTVDAPEPKDTTPPLTYPDGPYDLKKGAIFPNATLPGYRDGKGEWVEISMLDYYDPDGSRGITGLQIDVECQWCPPSNTLADEMAHWFPLGYEPRGGRLLTVLTEDITHKPATRTTIDQWIAKHHTDYDIILDDKSTLLPKTGSVGLPYRYTIDPRTMRIVAIMQGIDPGITTPCAKNADCCKTITSPDVCTVDYWCSASWTTCLTESASGPIPQLDALMLKNGAPEFPTLITKDAPDPDAGADASP
jgi:hypothetical protein